MSADVSAAFDTAPSADPLVPFFTDQKLRTKLPPNLVTGDTVEFEAVVHTKKWPKPGEFWFSHVRFFMFQCNRT